MMYDFAKKFERLILLDFSFFKTYSSLTVIFGGNSFFDVFLFLHKTSRRFPSSSNSPKIMNVILIERTRDKYFETFVNLRLLNYLELKSPL